MSVVTFRVRFRSVCSLLGFPFFPVRCCLGDNTGAIILGPCMLMKWDLGTNRWAETGFEQLPPTTRQPHTNPTESRETVGIGGNSPKANPVGQQGNLEYLRLFRGVPARFPKPGVASSNPAEGAARIRPGSPIEREAERSFDCL